MDTRRQVLVFGNSDMLGALAANLRPSPLLDVVERRTIEEVSAQGGIQTNVTVVDAAQITPEQFESLIRICPTILSVDPDTYQLTVLSSPRQANAIAGLAHVIGILSLTLEPA